jgi:hypothetical protein
MTLTRTGNAYGPDPLFNGTYTETIAWTIGPQTGPAQPAFQPFPDSGARAESIGFPTGEVLSLDATFTITTDDTLTTITGTKSLVANAGNYGVCRTFANEVTGSPAFGSTLLTGYFYILNAGVLSYDATVAGPGGTSIESGLAESYVMNSFATKFSGLAVSSANGHLQEGFGTAHSAAGTSGSASTAAGTNVVVEPLPGVDLTFTSIDAGGTTTAVLTTSVPPLPTGFQAGEPPAFYEISTTTSFAGLITVCLPYGSLPAGTTPRLLHYESGAWQDRTTTFIGPPMNVVCGGVSSLSPFAAVFLDYTLSGPFQPVDAQPTLNTVKAGQTVPVKFSLGSDFGLEVLAAGFPKSEGAACGSGTPDSIETVSNAAGLTYDAATRVYTFHWKTSKGWKGHCRTLTLQFLDGSDLEADFQFK